MNRLMVFLALLLLLAGSGSAQALPAPEEIKAFDTPNDAGGSVTLTWPKAEAAAAGTAYLVRVATSPEGPFHLVAEVEASGNLMSEDLAMFGHDEENERVHFVHVKDYRPEGADEAVSLESGQTYYFRLDVRSAGQTIEGTGVVQAQAFGNLFNNAKLNNLVMGIIFSALILISISMARRRELYIRRIAGLEALDEALGRATEMGKAVLFIHGLRDMSQISTIAAVNILGRVAKRTAEYDTLLRVANTDPVVMSVSQETVKESYIEAGRPDAYNPDNIFVAGTDQFSYAAAVEGMMVRERPAAHIMMGYFYAESLLLAETGSTTGAIQIAGTDAFTQLPFFVTTCDYTLMGEELYAASAYLSREPKLLGSLKGQDVGKGILIVAIVLGTLLASVGIPQLTYIFSAY